MVATQIRDGFFLSTASSFIPARNPDGVTDYDKGKERDGPWQTRDSALERVLQMDGVADVRR